MRRLCYLQCVASVRLRVPYVRTHGLPCIRGEGSQRSLVQTPPGSGKAFLVHTRCLDMSSIIPGTRWPAGSPSHLGARAPPALRGRALFKRWFKRVLHVSGLQVWDFARPRRNIRRAPQRCVGMRHPCARVTAILFLLLHPVIKRIRTNVPGNIWRPSPSKGKVIMGRFCSYERQQQKRRSQSSYL